MWLILTSLRLFWTWWASVLSCAWGTEKDEPCGRQAVLRWHQEPHIINPAWWQAHILSAVREPSGDHCCRNHGTSWREEGEQDSHVQPSVCTPSHAKLSSFQLVSTHKWQNVTNFYATFTLPQGILERLDAGEVVIGDGGFVFALEKRGYVKAGPWTPEAAAEHPEAGTAAAARRPLFTVCVCFSLQLRD